jgi:hypothetical protein
MRAAASIALVLALVVAGCGEIAGLKANVEAATPSGSRPAGECAGSEHFIESAWIRCIVVVHGTARSAIREVSDRLRAREFRVGCRDAVEGLELVATRGRTRIIAHAANGAITFDESDGGKPLDVVDARLAKPGSRQIPAGFVGLDISADKLRSSSESYPLPRSACPS